MDVSLNKLAELTGIDRRTVKKRLDGLAPRKVGRAYNYDSAQALSAIYAHAFNAGGSTQGTEKQDIDYNVERARLAKEKADGQALQNAKERGELIPVDQISQAWGRIATGIRNQFLALPNRLAQMLETTGTASERRAMIDAEVRTILEALADGKE